MAGLTLSIHLFLSKTMHRYIIFLKGKTWTQGKLIWKGPSAYSQLVPMGPTGGQLGLLFEAGEKSSYETITFVAVDM